MSGPWQTTKVKPTSSVLHLETLLAGMPATVGRSLLCCSQRRGRHGIGDLKDRKTADRRCACCTLLSSRAPGWQKKCELTLWKVSKKKKKKKKKKNTPMLYVTPKPQVAGIPVKALVQHYIHWVITLSSFLPKVIIRNNLKLNWHVCHIAISEDMYHYIIKCCLFNASGKKSAPEL